MPSLRSRFWASTISKIIDNAPEINHPNDIRRDFSEDRISFLRTNWKKKKYIDYTNINIDKLALLKLNNKKVAIEYNGMIISKSEFKKKCLKNKDKIEIVHFIGGG